MLETLSHIGGIAFLIACAFALYLILTIEEPKI